MKYALQVKRTSCVKCAFGTICGTLNFTAPKEQLHYAAEHNFTAACRNFTFDDIQCPSIDDIPQQVADDIHAFGVIGMRGCEKLLNYLAKYDIIFFEGSDCMAKNYLLIYSEQLATDIELLCQNIKAPSNTLFQIRKSSSSVHANVREANYGQSKADMLSKIVYDFKNIDFHR